MKKINLTPQQIENIRGAEKNAVQLFDQKLDTYWFPGWAVTDYPAEFKINLPQTIPIKKIRVYDGTGRPILKIYDKNKKIQLEIVLDKYLQWHEYLVDFKTDTIYVELNEPQGHQCIGELEFYTTDEIIVDPPHEEEEEIPEVIEVKVSGEALKIGTNTFHWVPIDLLQPFSIVRVYQMWEWFEDEKTLNRFQPTTGGAGNYDEYYKKLKSKNIAPVACVHQTPEWLLDGYDFDWSRKDFKPIPKGENPLVPNSYRYYSRFLFQYAARYGRRKHAPETLTINDKPRWTNDPINERKSGMDLLNYIEVWNEPDKWWTSSHAYFTAEQYAAMLSACYDGHENTMGVGCGIKNADPSMKVVMGGLSNFDIDYLDRMNKWFIANRKDRKFPADIVNFHRYQNLTGELFQGFSIGVTPEQDKLKERLLNIKKYISANLNNLPLWYSEFGYDTKENSVQRVPTNLSGFHIEEYQGVLLQRIYLESIAAGVDKLFLYNIIDENNEDNGLFQSSGIAYSELKGYGKKKGWKYLLELQRMLNGAKFVSDFSVGKIRFYKFVDSNLKEFGLIWSIDPELKMISEVPKIV